MHMDLRLFPLNTVLFPGMRMPLHIFEERYRVMIRECMEEDAPFGVLLLRSGPEVGSGGIPYDVGTAARILQVEYLEDGRMNIFAIGEQRFRIIAINTTQPYLRGEVTLLDQEPASDSAYASMARARQLFNDYLKTYLALGDQWTRGVYLPDDPAEAADYIAARMDVGPKIKQELLEQFDPGARLRRELEIMRELLPDMHGRLVAHLRQKTSGFAVLN
jgi:Lon protease-like protein